MRVATALLFLAFASVGADCPLGFTPDEACDASNPTCGLFTDANADERCDNPGPQVVPDTEEVLVDTTHLIEPVFPESTLVIEPNPADTIGIVLLSPVDTAGVIGLNPADTIGTAPPETTAATQPESLVVSLQDTTALTDTSAVPDTTAVLTTEPDTTASPRPHVLLTPDGCPRYLPPAAACPHSRQLCAHWYGRLPSQSCLGPSEGLARALEYLIFTVVLLVPATVFSRTIRGRKNRKKAKFARTLVLVISLAALGFWLQGCYCPIGMWQYLFLPMFGFLLWIGFALLMVPVVHAMFFGRVYCGWVCPLGALQELLGRIPVPGAPKIPRKLDSALAAARYIVAILFTAAVFAAGRGLFGIVWPALFCDIDPFHAIFSMFLTGSLTLGVAAIVLSIFFGRFFCRYLCFYGSVLSLACRFGLWSRLRGSGRRSCESPAKDTTSCEIPGE